MSLRYQLINPEDNLISLSSKMALSFRSMIKVIAQKLVEMITLKQILLVFLHK